MWSTSRFARRTIGGLAAVVAGCAAVLAVPGVAAADSCLPQDLGTGRELGQVLPPGVADPDWIMTSTPILGAPAPALVVSPHGLWATLPSAGWISVPGGSDPGPVPDLLGLRPLGTYVYERNFVVPPGGYGSSTTLTFLADNGVLFDVNGVTVGGFDPPLGGPDEFDAFQQTHTVTIDGGLFRAGRNTLTARVANKGAWTGLLVDGSVTVCGPLAAERSGDPPEIPEVDGEPTSKDPDLVHTGGI